MRSDELLRELKATIFWLSETCFKKCIYIFVHSQYLSKRKPFYKMKNAKRIYLSLILLSSVILSANHAFAQSARLQVIHNAAGILLDTVDVYLNGTRFDNVAFRTATPLLTVPSGSYRFSVNHRSSSDSADQVLFSQIVSFGSTNANLIVVCGVDSPANYASNPDSRSTGLRIIQRRNMLVTASSGVATTIIHGVTDAPGVDVVARPNASISSGLRYGDTTNNLFPAAVATAFDLRVAGTNTVVKTYNAPFQSFNRRSLVVLASGFLNPLTNQNGSAFKVIAVDTAGNVVTLDEVARMQIINNCPDVILNSVDVWMNNTKIASALDYRKATPMLTVKEGNYTITVTKRNSPDTSGTNVISRFTVTIESGKTYLGIASGVVDTSQYASNPNGINRRFELLGTDMFNEFTSSSQVNIMVSNGTPDAPELDINRLTPSAAKLGNDLSFKNGLSFVSLSAANGLLNITNNDSTVMFGTYRISLSGQGSKTAVLLTSGFKASAGNFTGSSIFQPILVFNDGSVQALNKLSSDVQVVHNSPDSTIEMVDIYIDGERALNNFKFRTATPFITLDAYKPYAIAIADSGSTSSATAFFNTTLTLDSSSNYYVIATGVRTPVNYDVNPNGQNISFNLATYKGAQKLAAYAKNVDLLFYHGATDLSMVTAKGLGQVQFLCKEKIFGQFHGYGFHSAQENLRFEVTDTSGYKEDMFGNLKDHQGKAGLVFASGFRRETGNQKRYPLMLMVAWPDGNVDSIAPARLIGLDEKNSNIESASFGCYPNPASTELNIVFNLNNAASVKIIMMDVTGKMKKNYSVEADFGKNEMNIPTAELSSGMYFITIQSGTQSISKKVLINQ